MSDYKDRMKAELSELEDRMLKLKAFLWSDPFNALDKEDRTLLIMQAAFMNSYRDVLEERYSRANNG